MTPTANQVSAEPIRRLALRQLPVGVGGDRRLRLIVNPTSRSGKGVECLAAAEPALRRSLWNLEICESRSGEHVRDLAAEASEKGYGGVVVCGGDGSLHWAVGGLVGRPTAVGLIPAGTGNDWARHVGIPADPAAAADIIAAASIRRLDVGRVVPLAQGGEPAYFNCVAGIGLDAEANRHIRNAPWLTGNIKYAYGGLRALLTYRPRTVDISMNGVRVRRKVMFTAVTNTRTYGGGMLITPDAALDDGRLDLCVVEEMSRLKMLYLFGRIYKGGHVGLSGVTLGRAERVVLDSAEPMPVWLDGEPSGLTTPVAVEVVPGALQVFSPIIP